VLGLWLWFGVVVGVVVVVAARLRLPAVRVFGVRAPQAWVLIVRGLLGLLLRVFVKSGMQFPLSSSGGGGGLGDGRWVRLPPIVEVRVGGR